MSDCSLALLMSGLALAAASSSLTFFALAQAFFATLGRHTVYLNVVSGLQSESEGEQRDAVFPPYPQLTVDIKKKR